MLGLGLGLVSGLGVSTAQSVASGVTGLLSSGLFWLDVRRPSSLTLDGSLVSQIDDQSSKGFNFSQSSSGRQPTYASSTAEMQFDGSNDSLEGFVLDSPTITTAQTLPDVTGSTAGKGFTNTGLAYDAGADTFWCGNDGRGEPSDTTHDPSIVNLSKDGSTVISQIDVSSIYASATSVQGVAIDTSDDSLWFALPTEGRVYNVDKDGSNASFLSITSANGVAYHSDNDTLITLTTGGQLRERNKSTGTTINTWTLSGSNWDQVSYDSARGGVWMTKGANGSDGEVYFLEFSSGNISDAMTFQGADSIEGIVVIGSTVYLNNDAYFHTGSPALNRLLTYEGTNIDHVYQTAKARSEIDFTMTFEVAGTLTPTDAIFTCGDPLTGEGWAVYVVNNTTLRIWVNDGSSDDSGDITVTDLSTRSVINVTVDLSDGGIEVFQDNVSRGTDTLTGLSSSIRWTRMQIADSEDNRNAVINVRSLAVRDSIMSAKDRLEVVEYFS